MKQLFAVELPLRVGSGLRARRGARRHAGPVIFLYPEQLSAWLKRRGARFGPRAEAA
jgi:hypothetical protein